jgi:nuclear cap-binding protein subunit 1
VRAFRTAVESREWLSARLLLQFLSLLVPAGLVSPQSILEVYRGLLTVLNEVGGGGDRSERAVRAVGEGLIRVGTLRLLYAHLPVVVNARCRIPRGRRGAHWQH